VSDQKVRWLGVEYDAVLDSDWLVAESLYLQKSLGKMAEWGDLELLIGVVVVSVKRHLPRFQFDVVSRLTLKELQDCLVSPDDDADTSDAPSGDALDPGDGGSEETSQSTEPLT
jgi:hypothetical protein